MLIYLIHLTMCWGLFALLYFILFRNETFFTLNRCYLLAALGISLVLPLLKLDLYEHRAGRNTNGDMLFLPEIVIGIQTVAAKGIGWGIWIKSIWAAGTIWMTVRFIWGLRTLKMIAGNAVKTERKEGIRYVFSEKVVLPFSFFNRVFLAASNDEDADLNTMIAHEKAHARGWHTMDILFCEALCIVFWWNPLVYWYKNALRTVHEYIADDETANQFSRKQYGLLLIRHAQSGPVLALANHFFQSPLKQRLVMLTKNASAPVRILKYCLVIPAITLVLIFTSQPVVSAQNSGNELTGNREKMSPVIKETANKLAEITEEVTKQPVPSDERPVKAESAEQDAQADETPAEYPGGTAALLKYLGENLKYPEAAKKEKAEGTVVVSFIVNPKGRVEKVEATKKLRTDMDEEAIRVIRSTVWVAATKNGKKVSSELCIPIKFKLQ